MRSDSSRTTVETQWSQQAQASIHRFLAWLERYGETSYDHQSFFAGPIGGRAKTLYYRNSLLGIPAVAPMIVCEAFVPVARRLFWKPQRFPIADAHYAMGFAMLSQSLGNRQYYEKAVHFLNVLENTRCPGYEHFCWGYPFDWVTSANGTIPAGTPLITTTPYVYEAFSSVYRIDRDEKWLRIMRSIADHAMCDIKDFETSPRARSCSYTPFDTGGVVNASAYRAFLLASASLQLADDKYWEVGKRNLQFVLESQRMDGSWPYSMDGKRDFVDHFHTCFVLKALAKIERLTGHQGAREGLDRGLGYYASNLFDERGLPKPFAKAPRLTVYKRELYDYAECINLCVLVRERSDQLSNVLPHVVDELLTVWQKSDGSFRARKLFLGWDNVPMHRWAQSQVFRSLSLLVSATPNKKV